jgi:hypothetical protein
VRWTWKLVFGALLAGLTLSGCFAEGTYPVAPTVQNGKIGVGLWHTAGGDGCSWARLRGFSGGSGDIIASNSQSGPQYVEVKSGDAGFRTSGCQLWVQADGAFDRKFPMSSAGLLAGDGMFRVGPELIPGRYRASSPSACHWARLRGFSGESGDLIASGVGQGLVDVGSADVGLKTQGCGTWTRIGDVPATQPPDPPPVVPLSGVLISGKVIDFPDPFILSTGSVYYAYATGSAFNTLQLARSSDGVTWTWVGDPFAGGSSAWATLFANTWSPEVLERPANPVADQRYVMYYTSKSHVAPTSGFQCIGRATSASPGGPFVDSSAAPLICQTASDGSIDASPYVAADGSLSLVWSTGSPSHTATIYSQPLTANGLDLSGAPVALLTVANNSWESPIVEAPELMTNPAGGLFLFYSGNLWTTSAYAEGVATCDTPSGPCTRVGTSPVLASRSTMLGPGAGSPFSKDGSWYFAFHAWEAPNVGYPAGGQRSLRLLPMTFPNGTPQIG